jgi:hypothetical protein
MKLLSRHYFALRDPFTGLFVSGIPTQRITTFTKTGARWSRRGAAEQHIARYYMFREMCGATGEYANSPLILEIVQTEVTEAISIHQTSDFDFGKIFGRMVHKRDAKYNAIDEDVLAYMSKLASKGYHPRYVFAISGEHEMVTKTRCRIWSHEGMQYIATHSEEDMIMLTLELADCTKAIYNFVDEKVHTRK